jgi:perosamine synthetase
VGVTAIVPVVDWELLGEPAYFPAAFKLSKETVSLPIYPTLTDNDIDTIIKGVSKS